MTKKATTTNKKKISSTKKTPTKKKTTANKGKNIVTITRKINPKVTKVLIVLFGVLFIFASYAWFSTNLNVKIRTFNLIVTRNSDLTISFDGVNFSRSIEITKDEVYDNLGDLYPNYLTQWPHNGLIPVSSPGVLDTNSKFLPMFETNGVLYTRKEKDRGFVRVSLAREDEPREYNSYLAFDLFIKNETGSPMPDNLYLESSTAFYAPEEEDEEMLGLVNSFRLGLVKVGSVSNKASVAEIQNIECNNNCEAIIYEPNSKNHTDLSIERAKKYKVDLVDGFKYPTYAYIKEGGPIYVENSVSGSPNLDQNYFALQETVTEDDFENPIFQIPDGITKVRVYVWIEGQDIDSLETNSIGTEVEINIDFVKDQAGYDAYNE